jgi:hypothetical protein
VYAYAIRRLLRFLYSTGVKPYKCTACDKCFSRVDVLTKHLRSHVTNEASHHRSLRSPHDHPEPLSTTGGTSQAFDNMTDHAQLLCGFASANIQLPASTHSPPERRQPQQQYPTPGPLPGTSSTPSPSADLLPLIDSNGSAILSSHSGTYNTVPSNGVPHGHGADATHLVHNPHLGWLDASEVQGLTNLSSTLDVSTLWNSTSDFWNIWLKEPLISRTFGPKEREREKAVKQAWLTRPYIRSDVTRPGTPTPRFNSSAHSEDILLDAHTAEAMQRQLAAGTVRCSPYSYRVLLNAHSLL